MRFLSKEQKKKIGYEYILDNINTVTVKPKKKRVGRYTGLTSKYKKAIVTVKKGEEIDFFSNI